MDLKILDPIWTTAYIVRNHGYMIYDTLLAQDEKGDIKLQMLEKYETAPDNKSYTFTLRDGLLWHDGQPVTSEDCNALTAWVAADVMNPVSTAYLNADCDKALFGWPCDAELEKLRDDFAREADPAKQKAIAEAVQLRAIEVTPEIPLGEFIQPVAMRKNVKGFVIAPVPVFWNLEVTK